MPASLDNFNCKAYLAIGLKPVLELVLGVCNNNKNNHPLVIGYSYKCTFRM